MNPYPQHVLEGWSLGDAHGHVGPPNATVGVYGVPDTTLGFDDPLLGRHVLFLGGIGTGKTVAMSALVESMRQAATDDDVFVFFDTKGDYIDRFYRDGDVSISSRVANPFPGQVTWNAFRELAAGDDDTELVDRAAELCTTLLDGVGEQAGEHNQIWTNMASDLLRALVVAYSRSGRNYTNADIRAMADKLTLSDIRSIIAPHSDLRGATIYIARDDSNTSTSVMIFLQQALRQIFSAGFRRPGDFAATEFLAQKGGRALFLEFDVSRASLETPIFRVLIDTILKSSLGRCAPKGRVFVVLDEFALLPRLRQIDAGLNFGRSLGLRFVVGTQNVGQVEAAYGDARGISILSGFGSVVSFRLYDEASRSFVRSRFGTNSKVIHYDAALKSRGVGEQHLLGNVVEDWHLTELPVGTAVVGLPDSPPVRFRFRHEANG